MQVGGARRWGGWCRQGLVRVLLAVDLLLAEDKRLIGVGGLFRGGQEVGAIGLFDWRPANIGIGVERIDLSLFGRIISWQKQQQTCRNKTRSHENYCQDNDVGLIFSHNSTCRMCSTRRNVPDMKILVTLYLSTSERGS